MQHIRVLLFNKLVNVCNNMQKLKSSIAYMNTEDLFHVDHPEWKWVRNSFIHGTLYNADINVQFQQPQTDMFYAVIWTLSVQCQADTRSLADCSRAVGWCQQNFDLQAKSGFLALCTGMCPCWWNSDNGWTCDNTICPNVWILLYYYFQFLLNQSILPKNTPS